MVKVIRPHFEEGCGITCGLSIDSHHYQLQTRTHVQHTPSYGINARDQVDSRTSSYPHFVQLKDFV